MLQTAMDFRSKVDHQRKKNFVYPYLKIFGESMNDLDTPTKPEFLSFINQPTRAQLHESVVAHWLDGRGFTLATLNLDHIVKMRRSSDFLEAYKAHTYVVADGNPIVWLSRLAGRPIELIPGSELIIPLSKLAAKKDVSVALLGATEDTLGQAAAHLQQISPELHITAQIAPPLGFDPMGPEAATYLETIKRSGARLCFIALGAPKQEILAARGIDLAPECGFVSIGAGLDFIAGSQTRAPRWVRSLALEWVWRLLSNPRRLAVRYGRCFLIMPDLLWRAIGARFSDQ